MDGTLTVPHLDFPQIKRAMGISPGESILEALAAMDAERQVEAHRVLHRHETESAEASQLAEGCQELLDWLAAESMPFAIITRNSRASLETIWRLHRLPMCETVTREDATFKPDPAPLHLACRRLGVGAIRAWMVGDGEHDIAAGNAAGIHSVWLRLGRPVRPFAATPMQTLENLPELLSLLRSMPPEQPSQPRRVFLDSTTLQG